MPELDGITYSSEASDEVVAILRRFRGSRTRIRVYYGDRVTGRAWGDTDTGRVSNSMGPMKVPILVNNARSYGGNLLEGSVVKVEYANKRDGGVLYQHPDYHEVPDAPIWWKR